MRHVGSLGQNCAFLSESSAAIVISMLHIYLEQDLKHPLQTHPCAQWTLFRMILLNSLCLQSSIDRVVEIGCGWRGSVPDIYLEVITDGTINKI